MQRHLLVLGLAALTLCACGGASVGGGLRPSSAFTEADAKLFEDGADFIGDPDGLAGRWADDWENEMHGRVAQSDLIAVATISTVATDVDPQQHTTYRLNAKLGKIWKGSAPGPELGLAVGEDALGYSGVDRDRQRILNGSFLLFVKWYAKPDGKLGAHWHLSTASQHVLTRVHAQLESTTPPKRTIIRHTVTSK